MSASQEDEDEDEGKRETRDDERVDGLVATPLRRARVTLDEVHQARLAAAIEERLDVAHAADGGAARRAAVDGRDLARRAGRRIGRHRRVLAGAGVLAAVAALAL